jgi:excisionase family DNA binding protein
VQSGWSHHQGNRRPQAVDCDIFIAKAGSYERAEPLCGASAMQSPMVSRRDEIIELRKAGLTYAEIGRRFGITKERVRQILNPKPPKPKSEKPALQSKLMLTTGDVGQLLGLHPNTVRRWSQKGILKVYHIGPRGDRRFRREDVDAFLGEEKGSGPTDISE